MYALIWNETSGKLVENRTMLFYYQQCSMLPSTLVQKRLNNRDLA